MGELSKSYFEKLAEDDKIKKTSPLLNISTSVPQKLAAPLHCTITKTGLVNLANEVKIIEASGLKDIGIVYNFHHGQKQMDDFENILKITKPYLSTVNINGMKADGPQIIPVGGGDREMGLLKSLKASGYSGSIGIIGPTENEDVKIVLERNIEGLKRLLAEMGDEKALRYVR